MRYQKKWINRFMIYQKIFVDILLLFNGMILNYLYFHFYDSRYILRLSKFQKMLTVCLLALMFVFVYSDFGYCSYIFTSLLGFLFIRIFYHFEEKSEYITQVVFFFILMFSDLFASIFTNLIIRFFDMQRNSVLELSYFSILLTTLIIIILYSFLNAKLIGISYKNLAKKELIIYVGSLVFSWLLCLILISFLLYFKDLLFQFFVCFVILFILIVGLYFKNGETTTNNNTTGGSSSSTTDYDVSKMKQVNIEESIKLFDEKGTHVLYIGRETCSVCKQFVPILNEVQEDLNFTSYYLDVDTFADIWNSKKADTTEVKELLKKVENLTDKMTIEATANGETGTLGELFIENGFTPALVVIQDGKVVEGFFGYRNATTLTEILEKYVK